MEKIHESKSKYLSSQRYCLQSLNLLSRAPQNAYFDQLCRGFSDSFVELFDKLIWQSCRIWTFLLEKKNFLGSLKNSLGEISTKKWYEISAFPKNSKNSDLIGWVFLKNLCYPLKHPTIEKKFRGGLLEIIVTLYWIVWCDLNVGFDSR